MPNLVEALHDPTSLGGLPAFRDLTSWRAWVVFLKAVYGLPLDPADFSPTRRTPAALIIHKKASQLLKLAGPISTTHGPG